MHVNKHRVLITGGSGFIGHHLSTALALAGHSVTVLDLKRPSSGELDGVRYLRGDMRDDVLLRNAVAGCDVVYHLAAMVSVPLCEENPDESFSVNIDATRKTLEAIGAENLRRQHPIRLLFASSAAVYGHLGEKGVALREDVTLPTPISLYATQKLFSEILIAHYCAGHGIPSMVFRFFNVFGRGQNPKSPYSGVITLFRERIDAGMAVELFGGGMQTRDFIWVGDLVQALCAALNSPLERWNAQPINLGSGIALTVKELGSMMAHLAGKPVRLQDAPARGGDVIHSRADIERARVVLGWQPETTLLQGLSHLVSPTKIAA